MAAIHGYVALTVTGGIPAGTVEQGLKNTVAFAPHGWGHSS
jgi:hypothetical protein